MFQRRRIRDLEEKLRVSKERANNLADLLRCSFCGCRRAEVTFFFAGDVGSYICENCVEEGAEHLAEERRAAEGDRLTAVETADPPTRGRIRRWQRKRDQAK